MAGPLRAVLVGVGRRGRWPVELTTADPHWEPVALVDLDEAMLGEARAIAGLPADRCFASLAEALASVESDAVIICAPTQRHFELASAALAAGRHVLVEKGMTTDLAHARRLVDQAEAAGRRLCVAQNYRYRPVERALWRHLRSGALGEPRLADLIHHRYRPEPRTLNYPGAVLWDMGCHHFDTLIHLFGPVAAVVGRTFNPPWSRYAHDAGASAVLEFESGPVVTYELTHCAQYNDYRFVLQTSAGTVWVGDDIRLRPTGARESATLQVSERGRSEQLVLDAFRAYIEAGVEPGISGRGNLQVMATSEAILQSAAQGRRVEVQPLLR